MRYSSAVGATLLLIAGCDSGPESSAPVRGKVAHRGFPLYTGTIVFTPDELRGTTGPLARGEIRPDGTYDLQTGDSRGVAPGWYRVTVMAMETRPIGNPAGGYPVPRSLLPDRYRDPELSGLSCNVKANQENVIDFNLQ